MLALLLIPAAALLSAGATHSAAEASRFDVHDLQGSRGHYAGPSFVDGAGDGVLVANVIGGEGRELVLADRGTGVAHPGLVEVWGLDAESGSLARVTSFTARGRAGDYSAGDAIASGNVLGKDWEQLVIAEDDGAAASTVDVWGWDGREFALLSSFHSQTAETGGYTNGDAFAVGDVWGDERDEIVIAEDGGDAQGNVDVWSFTGSWTRVMSFASRSPNTGGYSKSDDLVVGNVYGDAKEEILIAEDGGSGATWVDVWSLREKGFQRVHSFRTQGGGSGGFTKGDVLAVANLWGDARQEILVAEDGGSGQGMVDVWGNRGDAFSLVGTIRTGFSGEGRLSTGGLLSGGTEQVIVTRPGSTGPGSSPQAAQYYYFRIERNSRAAPCSEVAIPARSLQEAEGSVRRLYAEATRIERISMAQFYDADPCSG